MANNNFYARIQQKIDTEENWNKAVNFVPLKGEIIIYDIDSAHDYKRIKIGDGVTTVINLEFVADINDLGAITIDIEGATEGTPATIDADTFNGYTIDNFVMYNTNDGESDYMAKSVYDTDSDGVVDNAAKLGGKTPGQLTFGADQIIIDESTDERLPETLDKKLNKCVDVTITGEDINNYKTEGVYHFGNSVTPTNIPAGVNGWLVVIGGAGRDRKQLWFRQGTANSNDHEIYVRTLLGDVWSDWTMLITNKGGGFEKPIWVNNANPPSSNWNVKDIAVTKSDGSSITGGITKVIAMRRK